MTKNKDIYDIQELSINSKYNDLGAAYYHNGLVFASERTKGANQGRSSTNTFSFLDLYYTEVRHFEGEVCGTMKYGTPVKFSSKINSRLHEAIVTFNEDERHEEPVVSVDVDFCIGWAALRGRRKGAVPAS